jgi:hypothetical protein
VSDDIHALVGAYALDAVDDLERAAFDRHLRDCEACRADAADLQAAAARLADGTWSVPPPSLRESVLAEIATTRQVAPVAPARPRRSASLRLRLTAAAAAVVAAATAGSAVFVVQDQRVRHEHALAEAASREKVILSAPDLVVRQEDLTTGGHVTVATSRLQNAGVILLAGSAAPADGKVFEAWTIEAQGPVPAGTGRTTLSHVVEDLSATSAVAVTIEPASGSIRPTGPVIGQVKLT